MSLVFSAPAAQPGIAADRFARKIVGFLNVILCSALAAAECQAVGPHLSWCQEKSRVYAMIGLRRTTTERGVMYLDRLITEYDALDLDSLHGCTDEEIQVLEQELGLALPAAYREFLRWAGHDAGTIFLDLEDASYSHVRVFQDQARLLVAAAAFSTPLPQDAIVIHTYDTVQFAFIRASEGDDPPVYHFLGLPTHMTYTFENQQTPITKTIELPFNTPKTFVQEPSFTAWLANYIHGLSDASSP